MSKTTYSTTRLRDERNAVINPIVDLKEFREIMVKQWNETLINSALVNSHQEQQPLPTLPIKIVEYAGDILKNYLISLGKKEISVLEVMSGNCSGSRFLHRTISKGLKINEWICTDIIDFTKTIKENIKFHKLDGLKAVEQYGNCVDILLLMCPPPNQIFDGNHVNPMSLCDYYLMNDFIAMNKGKNKFIVFIGELGASDGTEGLYKYMLSNSKIKLSHRQMLISSYNQFGPIEKEIFIFSIL